MGTKDTLVKKFKEEIDAEKRKKIRLEWYLKQLLLEKEMLVKENEIEFAQAMQSIANLDPAPAAPTSRSETNCRSRSRMRISAQTSPAPAPPRRIPTSTSCQYLSRMRRASPSRKSSAPNGNRPTAGGMKTSCLNSSPFRHLSWCRARARVDQRV